MKPRPIRQVILMLPLIAWAAASILVPGSASGAPLSWDGNGTTAPNPNGGSGTWDTITTNWWDGISNVLWPSSGTDNDAIFGNTSGTVNIDAGGITANDLTFNTTGYVLTGGTLTLNGTTPTLTVGLGISAEISSIVAGTAGLVKAGDGTVVLSSANTYTGGTTLNGGTLAALDTTVYGTNNQVKKAFSTGTITLNGGTVQVRANGNGSTTTESLNYGNNVIVTADAAFDVGRESGSGTSKTIRFGNLSIGAQTLTVNAANSYAVQFGVATLSGNSTFDVQSGTLNLQSAVVGGTNTITKNGAGILILNNGGTLGDLIVNGGTADLFATNSMKDVTFNGASSISVHSGTIWSMNSLTYSSSLDSQLSAFSTNGTHTIGSGGLSMTTDRKLTLFAQNVGVINTMVLNGNVTITGNSGVVASTSGSALGTMLVDLGGATRSVDVATGKTFTLGITVQNGGITKTGDGILSLTGAAPTANLYSGMTTVSAGTLVLGKTAGVDAIAGDVTVQTGAILDWNAANQLADTTTIYLSGGSLKFDNNTETFASLVQTAGTVNFGGGTNAGMVTITGELRASGGSSINLNSGAIWSVGSADFTGFSGTAISTNGNSTTMNQFIIGSGGLTLTGQSISLARGTAGGTAGSQLTLNGNITASGTNNINVGGGAEGVAQVQLGASNRTFDIVSGTTTSNAAVVSSGGGLVKSGNGTLALTANNTYTGSTEVQAGTLRLTSSTSNNNIGSSSSISIATGATLNVSGISASGGFQVGSGQLLSGENGGGGNVTGATTILSGGSVAAGTDGTVGTLSFSNGLTSEGGSTWLVDIVGSAMGMGTGDSISVSGGALTLNSGTLLELNDSNWNAGNTFTIATYSSLTSGSRFTFNSMLLDDLDIFSTSNGDYQIHYGTGTSSGITLTAVPEPGTFAILAAAFGGCAWWRRRRFRRTHQD